MWRRRQNGTEARMRMSIRWRQRWEKESGKEEEKEMIISVQRE